jgi:hypothetical protein
MEYWSIGVVEKRGGAAGLCCSRAVKTLGETSLAGGESPPLLKTATPFMGAISHRFGGSQRNCGLQIDDFGLSNGQKRTWIGVVLT